MAIHVDGDELRNFAQRLQRFTEVLNDNMQQTQGQIGRLGETWQDREFHEFREVYQKTQPLLRQFIAEAEKTIPGLLRDAEAIDEYSQLKVD